MIEDKEKMITNLEIKASFGNDEQDEESDVNIPKKNSKSKTPVLDTYSKDLTKMAEEGKLDQIVGRQKEIDRVSQILSRRKKNNPLIIGEPGCVDKNTLITIRKIDFDGFHNVIIV
jgi:ATP-dependent Clp protease ATP-binding subunit ClpA